MNHIPIETIQAAKRCIDSSIHQTPLVNSDKLSAQYGTTLYLKCEQLQKTGSFKYRGALNKILSLSKVERDKGIIAASTGNHGLGVAKAAESTQTPATIFVPETASSTKVKQIESLGASIVRVSGDCLQAEQQARKEATAQQKTFISPYNDESIIAGQGTIGLELIQQAKALDAVFISVGGGGLVSGIASAIKVLSPQTKIIGVWPKHAPAMYESIRAGKIITVDEKPTLSDATAGGIEQGAITFPICQHLIDDCLLVTEEEIQSAMTLLNETEGFRVEGAAGVALAGFIQTSEQYRNQNVAIILCGGNITKEDFALTITGDKG